MPIWLLAYWKWIAGAAVILVVVGLLWAYGHSQYKSGYAEAENAYRDAAIGLQQKEQAQADKAASDLEKGNANADVVYKTITKTVDKIVVRPIYLNRCFDDDGLRIANTALSGPSSTPSGNNDSLPGPNTP